MTREPQLSDRIEYVQVMVEDSDLNGPKESAILIAAAIIHAAAMISESIDKKKEKGV